MMKSVLLTLFFISQSWAHEYLETKTHVEVQSKAAELRSKYGARNVLMVFDIDNTLLRAKQSLGSDQWFEWQSDAIKTGSSDAIFKTFDELIKTQSDIFQLSSMALTEQVLPQVIGSLKSAGHQIILLTSRAPDLRNVTERELENNKIWFSDSSIMAGIPYQFVEAPFKSKVSFMNGIFMTTGHHKGEALAYLLKKAHKNYKAIIFADDHERHTKRVYDTFSASNTTEIITFRYSKEDETVAAFKTSSKNLVNTQARNLLQVTKQLFKK